MSTSIAAKAAPSISPLELAVEAAVAARKRREQEHFERLEAARRTHEKQEVEDLRTGLLKLAPTLCGLLALEYAFNARLDHPMPHAHAIFRWAGQVLYIAEVMEHQFVLHYPGWENHIGWQAKAFLNPEADTESFLCFLGEFRSGWEEKERKAAEIKAATAAAEAERKAELAELQQKVNNIDPMARSKKRGKANGHAAAR